MQFNNAFPVILATRTIDALCTRLAPNWAHA